MFWGINIDGNAEHGQAQTALARGNGICVTIPFQKNSDPRFWFHQQQLDWDSAPQIQAQHGSKPISASSS